MPKKTQTFPVSSSVDVGEDTIGPILRIVPLGGKVSSTSVGTRLAPDAIPHVAVEQGAAAQAPIVSRYILPDQDPRPLSVGSIVRPA